MRKKPRLHRTFFNIKDLPRRWAFGSLRSPHRYRLTRIDASPPGLRTCKLAKTPQCYTPSTTPILIFFSIFLTYRVTYTSRLVMAKNIFLKINTQLKYIFLTNILTYKLTPPPQKKGVFFHDLCFLFVAIFEKKKIFRKC